MRRTGSSPAIWRIASIISSMLALNPGRVMLRLTPRASAGSSLARRNASTTRRGERIHMVASGVTGQTLSCPVSGSRMIPLAKEDAALLGLPGRTTMVGNRSARPSMKPLRL